MLPLPATYNFPTAYIPIGSMYGIYANIWGISMINVTIYYIAYMDPMGYIYIWLVVWNHGILNDFPIIF